MSFIQFIIEFSIIGQNNVGQATLKRHLAPRTVSLIRFQLRKPLQSRVIVRDNEVDIPFKIGRVGPEDTKRDVRRGDVGYWPQGRTLIIFLKDKEIEYPVNIVGKIENMTFFDNLSIGKSIRLQIIEPLIDEEDYL